LDGFDGRCSDGKLFASIHLDVVRAPHLILGLDDFHVRFDHVGVCCPSPAQCFDFEEFNDIDVLSLVFRKSLQWLNVDVDFRKAP